MNRINWKSVAGWIAVAALVIILLLLLIDYLAPVSAADINNDQDIMEAQTRLAELGYDTGYTDGINGPATERALEQFQVDHCLNPTATLDGKTWQALHSRITPQCDPGSGSGGSGFAGPVDLKNNCKDC